MEKRECYNKSVMKEILIRTRNTAIGLLYKYVTKPIFFRQDPENVHDRMTFVGRLLGTNFVTRGLTHTFFGYRNEVLAQDILGIHFSNPIGLSAGFDKNAQLTSILPHVGFGFEEVGSITGEPCAGNPKPRLWRLPKSQSLVVYYGLKNDGAERIAARLRGKKMAFPLGISIAKTNCATTVDRDAGIADYVKAYKAFRGIGDYVTVNISCPNAFGGQPFTDTESLEKLLHAINAVRDEKPIFIKLSPDLTHAQLDDILHVAEKQKINGLISTNLTKDRTKMDIKDPIVPEKGGMSGKIVEKFSDAQIKYLYKKAGHKCVIIGCGGIFTAEDAYKKIRLGASLLQMITGMIYGGPQTISQINQGLVALLHRDGFKNISEAVGVDA